MTMNKKTILSLLLCLMLCASIFAFPAFADSTVIVIGGAVERNTSVVSYDSSAYVSSGAAVSSSGTNTVIVTGGGSAAAQTLSSSGTPSLGSVIVMPNGQVQNLPSQTVQQTQAQTQTVVQAQNSVQGQGIQTSSAQTAAASNPSVVIPTQSTTVQTKASDAAPNDLANSLLSLINETRAANGLPALRYSSALQASADTRAAESVQNFSHMRPNGTGCETAVTVDYTVTGENLIQVTSEAASAAIMVDTWMNSPTHRNNILLSSFTEMAVGIYVVNGITYVSTVFVGY